MENHCHDNGWYGDLSGISPIENSSSADVTDNADFINRKSALSAPSADEK